VVYGPQSDADKVEFLAELRQFRADTSGPWFLCGDFNTIHRAKVNNNGRLDRRYMRRFRNFLNSSQLDEVVLSGRRFTWSNGRDQPTLERLDRMFASADWFAEFPRHVLTPLSSDCSDHCPLLLAVQATEGGKRRFRFEAFWVNIPGFSDVLAAAWAIPLPGADPFRVVDQKLRLVAQELKRWSSEKIGSIQLQLTMVRAVILKFDEEQEVRPLHQWELELRRALKPRVLGLASLARTIARQRSRLLFLAEGDANTRFYHLQACHCGRQNRIRSLLVEGEQVTSAQDISSALYDFYNNVLGTNFQRSRRIDLNTIGVPSLDLSALEVLFSEDEVWAVVKELPNDKSPGPDGFTGRFYKVAWATIKADIINAINAFWANDFRSFSHLNDAHLVLLKKKEHPEQIKDFRPISLIHSFGKLITKCLANRLAAVLDQLVQNNQSAFIKGRSLHDNFRNVQLTCKALHRARRPCILLKVDIARAFDSVDWIFLLEVLTQMGFGQRWRDWISAILSTASTRILLNGQPGRRICHARGLQCCSCL
jgi:hypothetical protein